VHPAENNPILHKLGYDFTSCAALKSSKPTGKKVRDIARWQSVFPCVQGFNSYCGKDLPSSGRF
jgi:hypothetical protein